MNLSVALRSFCLLTFGALLLVISGCGEDEKPENFDAPGTEALAMVPIELWLDDEIATSDNFHKTSSAYTLYSELSTGLVPLELHFNNQHSVYAAEVLVEGAPNHVFFFQNKRVVYSEHTDDSGRLWKVAYANNIPYAAATRNTNGGWQSEDHNILPVSQNIISETISRVGIFEIQHGRKVERLRSDAKPNSVRDTLFAAEEKTVLVNARAGDELAIGITSKSPHIYFTLSHQQSRMEHKNWRGNVPRSGDIRVTVFSLIENEIQPYQLTAELINR